MNRIIWQPISRQWRDDMFFIVLGISVFAAVSGVVFISHWKFEENKDYLYDETDAFGKRQFKRWRF